MDAALWWPPADTPPPDQRLDPLSSRPNLISAFGGGGVGAIRPTDRLRAMQQKSVVAAAGKFRHKLDPNDPRNAELLEFLRAHALDGG
jgi:hypothetical protein